MASVEISQIKKSYGSVEVLHGIDLRIEDGEFVVLVGPSGCGKSTLLRMIGGLEDITAGTVSIADRVVNNVSAKARDIAMVFQSYALYPHFTVFDNMGFSLKMAKVSKPEIIRRVHEAAETLGLMELLTRLPRQLSGGQRQRVAMGRAIVRNPKVFLFDEPLSNLDAKLRVSMRTEIKSLHQRLSTTAIYVTHDQVEAMTMADKIVVMSEGHIEQVGAPMDLFDDPINMFVAGFIGSPSINFIPGRIVAKGNKLVFDSGDGQMLPLPPLSNAKKDTDAVYGVRPKYLVAKKGSGVKAKVNVVEPTGSETFAYCDMGSHSICIQFDEREKLTPGGTIEIEPLTERALLFDPKSGLRIR